MAKSSSKTKKTLLKMLKSSFSGLTQCEEVDVKEAYRLPDKKVRIQIKQTAYPRTHLQNGLPCRPTKDNLHPRGIVAWAADDQPRLPSNAERSRVVVRANRFQARNGPCPKEGQ